MTAVNRSQNVVRHTEQSRFGRVVFPIRRLHNKYQIVSFKIVVCLRCCYLLNNFAKKGGISHRTVVLKNFLVKIILFQTWLNM